MGEVEYAPGEPKGTPWHPHRGFETVTYIIDGTFVHQDSHGGGGLITNGATQWMTAGGGILHIETPPEELVVSGGLFHGIQLWVNLPGRQQDDRPALPEPRGRRGRRCSPPPDGGALRARHRRRPRRPRGPGRRPTRRSRWSTPPSQPGRASSTAVAPRLQRPGLRARRRRHRRRGAAGRSDTGQLARVRRRRRRHHRAPTSAGRRTPALEVLLLGGQPIREPVAGTARS